MKAHVLSEQALATLHAQESQERLGLALGHAGHSQVSRLIAPVMAGTRAYADVYSFAQGLTLAKAYPDLRSAVLAELGATERSDGEVAADLLRLTGDAGAAIAAMSDALRDGAVSPREAQRLHETLCSLRGLIDVCLAELARLNQVRA